MSITLESIAVDGQLLQATFTPSIGMNLISFKKGAREVIDQSTTSLFQDHFAGLGALIGPHFHRRKPDQISALPFEERFSHIARVKAKGIQEPFSHGIARYAPWICTSTGNTLHAKISGEDVWNDVSLSVLEGFHFTMRLDARLTPQGLFLELSVDADRPSIVGYHYYYQIGSVADVTMQNTKPQYFDGQTLSETPSAWIEKEHIKMPIQGAIDWGFYPQEIGKTSTILMQSGKESLRVSYQSQTEESSLQIYHPVNASYVCIEPLSATLPRNPKLFSSGVNMQIEIL